MPNRVIVIAGFMTAPSIVSKHFLLAAHIVSVVAYEKELANCFSGGITVIVLQDAAETMLACDLAKIKRGYVFVIFKCSARRRQQIVTQTLVRSAFEIIGNVFRNNKNKVEVYFTEYDKTVRGFLFNRLYPTFDINRQIGSMRSNGLHYPLLLQLKDG